MCSVCVGTHLLPFSLLRECRLHVERERKKLTGHTYPQSHTHERLATGASGAAAAVAAEAEGERGDSGTQSPFSLTYKRERGSRESH